MPHFKKYVEIDKINFKNLSKKNQKTECDIMDLNKKILIISMLVMLVCCVSAVSATDIDSTDDVSDDIVVDEVTDVVEDVEIDEVEDDPVEEQEANPVTTGTINGQTWDTYVYNTTGYLKTNDNLVFSGDFYAQSFGNIKVDKNIQINAENATFHNIGFDLSVSQITLNGGTFIFNESAAVNAVIYDLGSGNTIKNTVMNITAPENNDFYAINLNQPNGAEILNNNIYYVDNYDNDGYYNYIVKIKGGSNVIMVGNNITAILPMKTIDWYNPNVTGSDKNYVAGIVVTESNYFNFTGNKLDLTGNRRVSYGPTLDAILIRESNSATIENNIIIEKDINSTTGQYSYIYGVDAFQCGNLKINNNTITMNADQSGGYVGGNGTGAAYCVQLTGPHSGVVVSNNTLTTQNNGPNAAIYSQNYDGSTEITVSNNTITVTGKGTDATWDVVTGMELQDNVATVTGNTITVNNIGNYVSGYNVYGISYCQFTNTTHTYDIQNNTINVNNGRYTIYIMDGVSCNVTNNTLSSKYPRHSYSGNQTVEVIGTDNYIGPNN